ncbi:MAG: response regulator transcription factor [Proteobacteria bacterium]|nr:response regulator transcription factor [Pseudomonadota bacterium]
MAKNILIVDDDELFCQVLSSALESRGFVTKQAYNFKQSQKTIQQWQADYAVVDLRIGQDSGLKVCQMLLQNQPGIHIVILTGFASIATAVEAIKLGVIQYLTKPTDVETILKALTQDEVNLNIEIPNKPLPVKRLEWEHLQKILGENDGNISQTAKQLGMHRRTLQRKLNKKPVKTENE